MPKLTPESDFFNPDAGLKATRTRFKRSTTARANGTNPRALGLNPRALGTNPGRGKGRKVSAKEKLWRLFKKTVENLGQRTDRFASPELRFRVLKRDRFTCTYCGARAPFVLLHVDHVIPYSRGGETIYANLTTACEDCNLGKRADSVVEQW